MLWYNSFYMKVQRIYVGGWFQRTTLHLSELHDFLLEGSSPLDLDQDELLRLRNELDISSLEMKVDSFQYIYVETNAGVTFRIFEDGLIVLETEHLGDEVLQESIKALTDYYEKQLSSAFSYVFSLGAPVPKELANIKTVYPYFVVLKNESEEEVKKLFNQFQQGEYFHVEHSKYDIFRGNKLYIINNKDESLDSIRRFVEEQIFIREFKGQMHRYLNLHRIIWEKIARIKERGAIKGREVGQVRDKIERYSKTINLIDTRINQMSTYIGTREAITRNDDNLKDFLDVLEYKYETLSNTLEYIKEVWRMTRNYVQSAIVLLSEVQAAATQKSVENLTVVTSMGVGATLIGLFTTDQIPNITVFGVAYFFILALIGYVASRVIKWFYARKNYTISYDDYDRDLGK